MFGIRPKKERGPSRTLLLPLLSILVNCALGQTPERPFNARFQAKPLDPIPTRVMLLMKGLNPLSDGSFDIIGHWTLKVAEEDPDMKVHFGAQLLNGIIIHCWPSKKICEEYRASITLGVLIPLEPLTYKIVSWNGSKILGVKDIDPDVQMLLHVDVNSEEVEMEYRREPSPGRSRVFERWVLE